VDEGAAATAERHLRSAAGALQTIDRRLGGAGCGSLSELIATRRALRAALNAVDLRAIRDVYVAIESVAAEMRALDAALALARRLKSAR
jgi:hypothetical protein